MSNSKTQEERLDYLVEEFKADSDDYKDFCKPGYGKILKHLRKQLGLRQVDFAEALGVSSASYRNWETERFIPMRENYNEIKKFAIKKGVDIS